VNSEKSRLLAPAERDRGRLAQQVGAPRSDRLEAVDRGDLDEFHPERARGAAIAGGDRRRDAAAQLDRNSRTGWPAESSERERRRIGAMGEPDRAGLAECGRARRPVPPRRPSATSQKEHDGPCTT
jgi:hypothetical protein